MIHNPPHIYQLLKTYRLVTFLRPSETTLPIYISHLLKKYIGHQDYPAFLKTYQLYLQSIPFAQAKQAWGLNQAAASNSQKPLTFN